MQTVLLVNSKKCCKSNDFSCEFDVIVFVLPLGFRVVVIGAFYSVMVSSWGLCCWGFTAWGLGFGVSGLGFGVLGFRGFGFFVFFGVCGFWVRVQLVRKLVGWLRVGYVLVGLLVGRSDVRV